jgi:mRNA deadenylase 3'-5' endonuclease subunit Ccr4
LSFELEVVILTITPAIKQSKKMVLKNWTPAFAGVTDYV